MFANREDARSSGPPGTDLLRLAAHLAALGAFGSVPPLLFLVGPQGAVGGMVGGLLFIYVVWCLNHGYRDAARSWLLVGIVLGSTFGYAAYGGIEGWSLVVMVYLPMFSIFLGRARAAIGTWVGVGVVLILGLTYALPDIWLYGRPSADMIDRVRAVVLVAIVALCGVVATYATRRLERAVVTARSTERRATQAMERKTSFLANISHELRTPMNAILGYSDLVLEDNVVSATTAADVGRIRKAGEEMLALINEVLDLARRDAHGPGAPTDCAVSTLIHRWMADASGALVVDAGGLPIATVWGDPDHLAQLVRDLVRSYRRRGVIGLEISVSGASDGVLVGFRPLSGPRLGAIAMHLEWLIAERTASAGGVTLRRREGDAFEMLIPFRALKPARMVPMRRWPFGITFPRLPSDPMANLRVRLSIRLAWLSMGVLTVVGPGALLLHQESVVTLIPVIVWGAFLLGVLGLYRQGWHGPAAITMAIGQIIALAIVEGMFGGMADAGLLYFPVTAVLGTLIVGSRAGHWLTFAVIVAVGMVWGAGTLGWLPPSPPDSREVIAFQAVSATAMSAVLVALWSRPFEALLASAHDAAERASEADRAASHFLDSVSVEFRTPLNAILGYAEMLAEDETDPSVRADLMRIVDAGRHLLTVVDDVLDMSAIVADQLELEPRPIELAPLLTSVLTVVKPLLERRGNHLQVAMAPDAGVVLADPKRLRQILMNLLSNAAKFTDHGTVSVSAATQGPDQIVISVADTGIGIAAEDVEQLFLPFRQVHHGNPGQYGGTGLGLAISHRLATMMQGDITVRSVIGKGSVFSVSLPVPALLEHRSQVPAGCRAELS